MESQLGQGSTFFVTLPVQVQEQAKPPHESKPMSAIGT
jgi:hypothetical protein